VKLVPWLHISVFCACWWWAVVRVRGIWRCSRATMAARRRLVKKLFEILISSWSERGEVKTFWNMDMEERVKDIRCVRDGGSSSHEVYHALKEHVELRKLGGGGHFDKYND
jgi:hypothetical protein